MWAGIPVPKLLPDFQGALVFHGKKLIQLMGRYGEMPWPWVTLTAAFPF